MAKEVTLCFIIISKSREMQILQSEKGSRILYDGIITMDPQSYFGTNHDDCAVVSNFAGGPKPCGWGHDNNATHQLLRDDISCGQVVVKLVF